MNFTFEVIGKPVPKARPRFDAINKRIFTPKSTIAWQKLIAATGAQIFKSPPHAGPIALKMIFFMAPPSKWRKSKRLAAFQGLVEHIGTPDIDNLAKAVMDGLNGVIYRDDGQVVNLECKKKYGFPARVIVEVNLCESV